MTNLTAFEKVWLLLLAALLILVIVLLADGQLVSEGLASIVGSALGAILSVTGAVYAIGVASDREAREYRKFIGAVVQDMSWQNDILHRLIDVGDGEPTSPHLADKQKRQAEFLLDSMQVFEKESQDAKISDLELRKGIAQVKRAVRDARQLIDAAVKFDDPQSYLRDAVIGLESELIRFPTPITHLPDEEWENRYRYLHYT